VVVMMSVAISFEMFAIGEQIVNLDTQQDQKAKKLVNWSFVMTFKTASVADPTVVLFMPQSKKRKPTGQREHSRHMFMIDQLDLQFLHLVVKDVVHILQTLIPNLENLPFPFAKIF
jgi:hypothetical protein